MSICCLGLTSINHSSGRRGVLVRANLQVNRKSVVRAGVCILKPKIGSATAESDSPGINSQMEFFRQSNQDWVSRLEEREF